MNLSITLIIVLVTVAISLYASENQDLKRKFLLNPYQVHNQKQFYRVISHAFIHADFMHLGVNMYVLYSFGTNLEKTFVTIFGDIGLVYFVALYIGGIIFASLLSLQKHKDNPGYNSLGASGAVSAVLFASILIIHLVNYCCLESFQLWHFFLVFYILDTKCMRIKKDVPILHMTLI